MLIVALLLLLFWMGYRLWVSAYSYWEDRGFFAIKGRFPFGSSKDLALLSSYQGSCLKKMCETTEPAPYFGIYVMRDHLLVIKDPEIIKLVLTKDFLHFRDRHKFTRSQTEALGKHLFNLEGDEWQTLRNKLTPTFSSGKLKAMFPLFVSCSEALAKVLLEKLESVMDVRDSASGYAGNSICSCAFGIELSANPEAHAEVKEIGNDLFKARISHFVKLSALNLFPKLGKYFKPHFIPRKSGEEFIKLISSIVDHRRETGIRRNDFLDLLMDLREKGTIEDLVAEGITQSLEMTNELMAAQCFVFFAAGFESTSAVQSYSIYEMVIHQDMQKRLQAEIDDKLKKNGGLTYQAIQEMTFLDMVITEALRKYPGLPILTRKCTTDFVLPSGQMIEKGTGVVIPVYALHHDPKYFPDPDRFDPERFAPENKHKLTPYTYLAFGEGPRSCLAKRFGKLQTKVALITLFSKYDVLQVPQTPVPLNFVGSPLFSTIAGPIYVKLVRRSL